MAYITCNQSCKVKRKSICRCEPPTEKSKTQKRKLNKKNHTPFKTGK